MEELLAKPQILGDFIVPSSPELPTSSKLAVLEQDCGCGIPWDPQIWIFHLPGWEFLGVLGGMEKLKPLLGQQLGGAAIQAPLPGGWGVNPGDVRDQE